MMLRLKCLFSLLLAVCMSMAIVDAQVIETWNGTNGEINIGKKVITQAGTYRIRGKVKGLITVAPGSGTVIIEGVSGTNPRFRDIDQDQANGKPHVIFANGRKVICRNFKLVYRFRKHKGIDLLGPGSEIRNLNITGKGDRETTAGHIQVGGNGLMAGCTASVNDDHYKVKLEGAEVKNSTAILKGNGSAITIDWGGGSGAGHYANNCTVKGFTNRDSRHGDTRLKTDDGRSWANHAAMSVVTKNNVSDVRFNNIRVEDAKDMSHVIRIIQTENGTIQGVTMTGTLPDGASKKTSPNGVKHSPVVINAGNGVIRNVTINFGGALSNRNWHYLNGNLQNVVIDGTRYDGNFNNQYGSTAGGNLAGPARMGLPSDQEVSEQARIEAIHLYPNPARGQFILTDLKAHDLIDIYDLQGKQVYHQHIEVDGQQKIGVASLPAGIYQLTVRDQLGNVSRKKLILE